MSISLWLVLGKTQNIQLNSLVWIVILFLKIYPVEAQLTFTHEIQNGMLMLLDHHTGLQLHCFKQIDSIFCFYCWVLHCTPSCRYSGHCFSVAFLCVVACIFLCPSVLIYPLGFSILFDFFT